MKILILDDLKIRHKIFCEYYKDHEIHCVYTYNEFVEKLKLDNYDLIHLDHDLGCDGDIYTDNWGEDHYYNGLDAAKKICELDKKYEGIVIIHSINKKGSENILRLLSTFNIKAFHQPFNALDLKI